MRNRLCHLVAALSLIVPALHAQETKKPVPQTPFAAVVTLSAGRPAVVVSYPWSAHEGASIEVRLVAGEQPAGTQFHPIQFISRHCKGDAKVKIYRARDQAIDAPTHKSHKDPDLEFEIFGQQSTAGRAAVVVVPKLAEGEPPGASAVFCFLESWSLDRQRLWLDLPRTGFAPPGELYVWFLRGDRLLWEEKLQWPGFAGEAGKGQTLATKPVPPGEKPKRPAAKPKRAKDEDDS